MGRVSKQSVNQAKSAIQAPRRVVFRIPPVAMLAVLGFIVCAVPFAFGGLPGLQLVYVFPVLAALWVLRNRTTADDETLVARSTFGSDVLSWSEVAALRVDGGTWVRAVLADSREVTLPAVRLRHLPMLAAISGGRFSDPSAAPATAVEQAAAPEPASKPEQAVENTPVAEQPGEH